MVDIFHPFEHQMVEEISLVDWNSPPVYDKYVDDDMEEIKRMHRHLTNQISRIKNRRRGVVVSEGEGGICLQCVDHFHDYAPWFESTEEGDCCSAVYNELAQDTVSLNYLSSNYGCENIEASSLIHLSMPPLFDRCLSNCEICDGFSLSNNKSFGGREEGFSSHESLKEVGDVAEVGDIKFQDIVDVKEDTTYEYIDFIGFDIFNWKASQVLVDLVNQMKIDISWIARFFMEHECSTSRIRKYSKYLFTWKAKNQFQDYNGVNKDLNSRMSFFKEEENDAVTKALMHVLESTKSLMHIGTIKYI
ncbi:hypothetical protein DVH24_025522 [Malus domestica]|uniref:Uncharacterized protein n=1 Tax=Malus domestica TaxID=3750 RepID=A0A498HS93_MALDO|nr:hypothetical protein DVH24_025522 [Malus domestica]